MTEGRWVLNERFQARLLLFANGKRTLWFGKQPRPGRFGFGDGGGEDWRY